MVVATGSLIGCSCVPEMCYTLCGKCLESLDIKLIPYQLQQSSYSRVITLFAGIFVLAALFDTKHNKFLVNNRTPALVVRLTVSRARCLCLQAYRIAHLPPRPPPELPGEGEGFPLEEEDEED